MKYLEAHYSDIFGLHELNSLAKMALFAHRLKIIFIKAGSRCKFWAIYGKRKLCCMLGWIDFHLFFLLIMSPDNKTQLDGVEDPQASLIIRKNLVGAAMIGLLAMLTMFFSLRLVIPGSIYTAPGLLPFIVGFTLLLMAIILGMQSIRAGALTQSNTFFSGLAYTSWSEEDRRRLMLAALIVMYVLLVAFVNFNWQIPGAPFGFEISSYEVISIVMVTWILFLFWRARITKCLVIAVINVEFLANIFRYGFGILMPETF